MRSLSLSTWHHVENTRDCHTSQGVGLCPGAWTAHVGLCAAAEVGGDIEDSLRDTKEVQAFWRKKSFPDASRLTHDLEQGACEDRKRHPHPRAPSSCSTEWRVRCREAAQVFSRKPWLLAPHLPGIPASLAPSPVRGWGLSVDPVTPASCRTGPASGAQATPGSLMAPWRRVCGSECLSCHLLDTCVSLLAHFCIFL